MNLYRASINSLWVLQGARIGKGVYIDSLDISDPEMINIGDDTVVNEGVTIAGHYFKDNSVHFGQVMEEEFVLLHANHPTLLQHVACTPH
jgi:serine acetyltransferase